MTTGIDQTQAVWKPLPGLYPYEISDLGQVRSVKYDPSKIIKPKMRGGYISVQMCFNGRKTDKVLHRLMAIWLPDPLPGQVLIRHVEGDVWDNRAVSLAWGTQSENMADAVRHGTNPQSRKTHCIRDHEFTNENTIWHGPDNRWRRCRICTDARRSR